MARRRHASNDTLEQQLVDRNLTLLNLKDQLNLAQDRMKKQAVKHRRNLEFATEDMVYLKIKTVSPKIPFSQEM